jgi:RhtB (resistance to homoserine/threonine) family protein
MLNEVSIISLYFLGLISPGPDFSVVVKNSLSKGRKSGVLTALGIASGNATHITACILGLSSIATEQSSLIKWIRMLGGLYLIFLAYKSFTAKPMESLATDGSVTVSKRTSSFIEGYLCNLLNPYSILFFMSIFASLLLQKTLGTVWSIGLGMVLTAAMWFSTVSVLFSLKIMTKNFLKHAKLLNRVFGVLLALFGLKLLLA